MSVALRPEPVTLPEFEHTDGVVRSVHYLEHGFPSPLVRWHHHDDYELHLIVASGGKVFVGDHVGGFGPGHLVLTGPRLPHNWISQVAPGETVPLRDRVVQFRQELVPGMAALAPELGALLPLLERSRRGIEFDARLAPTMEDRLLAIRDADGPARIALLLGALDLLARQHRYRLLSAAPMRSDGDEAALDKIERVTRHVTEHYAGELTLGDAAGLVGMHESTFSRFFARATGNGFSRFVNRIRIAKACELLAGTDEPITGICFAVGFNNVANFNRRFRELKSVTPREYRKQARLRHASRLAGDGEA